MKNSLLIITVLLSFVSCQKNAEQIDIVKKQISSKYTSAENEQMKYECFEILDKDAHKILSDKAHDNYLTMYRVGGNKYAEEYLETESKYIDSIGKATDKTFYKVDYYRISAKDTVTKGYIILNDQNKKIGFRYQK